MSYLKYFFSLLKPGEELDIEVAIHNHTKLYEEAGFSEIVAQALANRDGIIKSYEAMVDAGNRAMTACVFFAMGMFGFVLFVLLVEVARYAQ